MARGARTVGCPLLSQKCRVETTVSRDQTTYPMRRRHTEGSGAAVVKANVGWLRDELAAQDERRIELGIPFCEIGFRRGHAAATSGAISQLHGPAIDSSHVRTRGAAPGCPW